MSTISKKSRSSSVSTVLDMGKGKWLIKIEMKKADFGDWLECGKCGTFLKGQRKLRMHRARCIRIRARHDPVKVVQRRRNRSDFGSLKTMSRLKLETKVQDFQREIQNLKMEAGKQAHLKADSISKLEEGMEELKTKTKALEGDVKFWKEKYRIAEKDRKHFRVRIFQIQAQLKAALEDDENNNNGMTDDLETMDQLST